jgi:hypothetical protein
VDALWLPPIEKTALAGTERCKVLANAYLVLRGKVEKSSDVPCSKPTMIQH